MRSKNPHLESPIGSMSGILDLEPRSGILDLEPMSGILDLDRDLDCSEGRDNGIHISFFTSEPKLKPTGDFTKLGYSRNRDVKNQVCKFYKP